LIAGDATRGFYLGRRHHKMGEAIASAIADRAYGLLALFWFAAVNSVFLNRGTLPPKVINPTLAIGAVTFAGYLASPLIARMIHLTPRPIRRALGIIAPYLHRPISVLPAIALSVALQASLAIAQYVLALGIGLHVPLADFMLIVPIANVFAAMPITFNGLGVRETAYLILFGMAGLSRDDAIALGLLWFAATMLGGMTGAIAFVTTPVPSGPREAAGS
jgi:glycosyltransferase 2 family protein